jgi:hypothetical protein
MRCVGYRQVWQYLDGESVWARCARKPLRPHDNGETATDVAACHRDVKELTARPGPAGQIEAWLPNNSRGKTGALCALIKKTFTASILYNTP